MVVYPLEVVHGLLGHTHEGSTRKELSRYEIGGITGYPVDEVEWMLDQRTVDPSDSWPRTKGARTRKRSE